MNMTQKDIRLFEELLRLGTPLDPTVLEEARARCQGIEITQTGSLVESGLYAQASGGVGIVVSLSIENISNRVITLESIQLKTPWPGADFSWLKKASPRELSKWGGYVIPGGGTCGFDHSVVLNHRLRRNLKLYPDEPIEGLLLGAGTTSVPADYPNRKLVPVQLVAFTTRGEAYGTWVELLLCREEQGRSRTSASKQQVRSRLCELTK
jgi:hypothetical protein